MYYFGYLMLIVCLIVSMGTCALTLVQLLTHDEHDHALVRNAHLVSSGSLLLACAALLHGLFWQDYSLQYAANYTDRYLSLFYRLTAFWAGQPGSMLFWTVAIAISGTLFARSSHHARLGLECRRWFWLFFHLVLVFFTLLLATYSNPFLMQTPAPADGNGLNPLLQNPGMIIHPPLLFIGYAGFIVPTCLALAQGLAPMGPKQLPWYAHTRPFLLTAWIFLTAGILLGAWWAYMELGWGGYWAWDPVENSSLIPWLTGTSLLHALVLERRCHTLHRFNIFLVSLTAIMTLFATYLVRSGVVDSVHAFGQSAVGTPLLVGVLVFCMLSVYISIHAVKGTGALPSPLQREGLLGIMTWFLLALAGIILLATIWPVLTRLVTATPQGLDAQFYNKVCLPLAAVLLLLLAFCPWLSAQDTRRRTMLLLLTLVLLAVVLACVMTGHTHPTATLAAGAGTATMVGVGVQLARSFKQAPLRALGLFGAHLGLACCALAVAFSGPYSFEEDVELAPHESIDIAGYELTLEDLRETGGPGYTAITTLLRVRKHNEEICLLAPERRVYEKFGSMQFSEVDTHPSLLNELYVSLLGLTREQRAVIRFSVKPLVNWLWIGGALMSLLPLFSLFPNRGRTPSKAPLRADTPS